MMINAENMFLHIQKRKNEVLKDFLSKNGIETTDPEGRTALINAAFYNNIDLLEWLINQEADINAKDYIGYTALHFACQEGHIDSVKLLLLNNADVNIVDEHGNTPAWVTIMHWKGGKNLSILKEWFKITLRKNYLCKLFCYNEKQVHKSDAHFREKNERDYSSFLPRYRGRKDVCFNKYFSPYHQ